jgi:very-short-patch-repair endonuclease
MDETPVLVGIMNSRRDWDIVHRDRWYRIPVKSAPRRLREIRYLAFYQTKAFGTERWAVNYYAAVRACRVVRRRHLLPDEAAHPRADEPYYQLRLGELQSLPRPILSRRLRRIVFIPTTWEKLQRADEINDLFHESPLEDTVWEAFKRERIEAERQLYVAERRVAYCLDFAIMCQRGKVDVECDGDTWHAQKDAIPKDNARNNFLTSRGWSVLRFASKQINEELSICLGNVKDTVNSLGGLETVEGFPRRFEGSDQARQLGFW